MLTATIENMMGALAGDDLEWIFTQVGPSNTEVKAEVELEEENQAEIKTKLKSKSKTDADYIISQLNHNYAIPDGIEVSFEKEQSALQSILGTEGAPVVIEIKGEELELIEDCNEVKEKITSIAGYTISALLWRKGLPKSIFPLTV
ncbi:MAG: hypothetical protein V8S95_08360 [Odoribacter sp.]